MNTHQRPSAASFTRRSFIAAGAAAASITILKPSVVRGFAANSKIELGVIGCGGRGAWIAGLFARHGGYHMSAVADYFPQVAAACGDALGVAKDRRFSGLLAYQRLIASKVDAVALETPPWFFPEHAAAAVAAGCHVYMAKPVACDVPGVLSILASGKKSTAAQRVFLVDFQMRADPYCQEAVKRVHEGALGKVSLLSSWYCDESFADPPKTKTIESRLTRLIWVNDEDLGASYLVNAGIHAIDFALWIARDRAPLSAMGSSRTGRPDPHGDSHDVYSLTFEFTDGLILNHRGEHINNLHGFECGCHAYGQGAYMEGNYAGKTWLRGGARQYKGGENPGLYENGAVANIATFHKNVTERIYDNPTVAPSVNSTLTTILGREAAKINGKLTWDEVFKANRKLNVDLSGLTR